jgi:hypothetical protein
MQPPTFAFDFDARYRRILWCLGITPARSWVRVAGGRLDVRFGPWKLGTTVGNIDCMEVTGPYAAHRAIGPHISLVDQGLSFGSTTARGVCLRFIEAVPGPSTLGLVKHTGLTVTVADPDGLIAAVGREQDAG